MSLAEQHAQEWDRAAGQAVDGVMMYTNALFAAYLPMIVYERRGTITARNTATRQATVQLSDTAAGQTPTIQATYGTPVIQSSDIGKPVRVWERVEFRQQRTGRPIVTGRVYTVDTVLGENR